MLVSCPFEPEVREPEELLARYRTLVGWGEALLQAGAGPVTVLQRFSRALELRRAGIVYRFVADGGPALAPPWYWGQRMVEAARAVEPGIVHVDGLVFPLLVRHLRLALPRSTAIVVQDHGGIHDGSAGFRRRRWRALHRLGLRAADAFFFTARELAAPWRAAGILAPTQAVYEILESSVDLRERAQQQHLLAQPRAGAGAGAVRGAPALLWVGRLDANKDPLTVLRGFERLLVARPAATLTMVFGAAELLPDLGRMLAARPALSACVQLRGALPQEALAELYASADVFVLGSHHEGSGFALLEALSFGVTPVVTDIPAFHCILDGGRVGALFPVGDFEAMAAAIGSLFPEVSPATPEVAAGRRLAVRQHFDRELAWPVVGARALAAYRAISERRRGNAPPSRA